MSFNPFKRSPDLPTNEAVINAIIALASDSTPQNQRKFYNTLLNSNLLLAEDPEASSRPILFVDESGDVILPVFTDADRLKSVFPDAQRYSPLPVQQLCGLALSNEIYSININPEQGPGCYLLRDEMEALANGKLPDVSHGSNTDWANPNFIPMGDPKLPTEDELEQLTNAAALLLQGEPSVDAAYLIMLGSEEGDSSLTVALEFNVNANQQLKTDCTGRFVPALEAKVNRPMGVVWLEGEQLQAVQARVKPFYTQS